MTKKGQGRNKGYSSISSRRSVRSIPHVPKCIVKLVEDCRSESIINGIEGRNNKSQTSQSPIDKQIYKWGKRMEKTDNNRTSFLFLSPTSLPPLLGTRTAAPHRSSDSALGARPSSASEGKSLQRGRCSGGRCVEERGYSFLRRLSPPTQNGSLICILCWRLMHTATVRFERHFCLCVPVCVRCWRKPKGTF